MSRKRPNAPGQRGFGLVEMMVAIVLGLLLLAAAVQVFLSTRASYRYNQALSEVQDSARYAMHVLAHDMRLAGYTGCPSAQSAAPSVANASPYGQVRVIAESAVAAGIDGTNLLQDALADPGNRLPGSADPNSNAIRLEYMRDYGVRVNEPTASANANLKISGNPANWKAGDELLVTDCRQADLFAATSVSQAAGSASVTIAHAKGQGQGTNANTDNKLSKPYDDGARVLHPYAVVYYVRENQAGLLRHEYFAKPAGGSITATELASGISDLTVRYGVDTSGDQAPDVYRQPTQVEANGEWADVVSARVGFIAASDTLVGGEDVSSLTVLDRNVQVPDDGLLRRVFTITIALRNRVS